MSRVCEECGKSFAQLSSVYRHIRMVHKKQFYVRLPKPATIKCEKCSKRFCSGRSLSRHRRVYHTSNDIVPKIIKTDYICNSCEAKFKSKSALANHSREHMPPYSIALLQHDQQCKLPENMKYAITKYNYNEAEKMFTSTELTFPVRDKDDAKVWLHKFEEQNKLILRKCYMKPAIKAQVVYKQKFRCGHWVKSSSNKKTSMSERQTFCPFRLRMIVIKRTTRCIAKTVFIQKHNHIVGSKASVKFRTVSKEVRDKILGFYHRGYTPAEAIKAHLRDMKEEYGNEFCQIQGDRHFLPDNKWFYHLHSNVFRKEFGERCGFKVLQTLQEKIDDYNSDGTAVAKMKIIDSDNNYVISIVSSLMFRVHEKIIQSSELAFINNVRTTDQLGMKVMIILTDSCVGSLPLATIITTSDSANAISVGFNLIKESISENCFAKRGLRGPYIFLINDNTIEREALKHNFPEAQLLLNQFHLLEAMWRFIWNNQNGIKNAHKLQLFNFFKKLIHKKEEEMFHTEFFRMMENEIVLLYPNFVNYLKKKYERAKEWASCYRLDIVSREQNVHRLSEANIRVLKEILLEKFETYSPVQIFRILTTDLEQYYATRLVSLCNGDIPSPLIDKFSKLTIKFADLAYDLARKVTDQRQNRSYEVDPILGFCSCPNAKVDQLCEHLFYILKRMYVEHLLLTPVEEKLKTDLLFIAMGRTTSNEDQLFDQLQQIEPSNEEENSSSENLPLDKWVDSANVEWIENIPIEHTTAEDDLKAKVPIERRHEMSTDAVNNFSNDDAENMASSVREMCEDIIKRVRNSENSNLKLALQEMVQTWKSITTESQLISAFMDFGKYSYYHYKY